MKERKHVLNILEQTRKALDAGDASTLRDLSNQTVHTSSIDQDPDNVAVAVIVYSLSKIVERKEYHKLPQWKKFYSTVVNCLDKTILSLQKQDDVGARKCLEQTRRAIGKVSGKLKDYIQDVFEKASINKASKIYEHGISMEKTASLLGISMFELAEYAGGQKEISDVPLAKTLGVRKRLKVVEDFFR